jgi:hypothetical protein
MQTLTYRPSKRHSDIIDKLKELATKDNRKLNNYIEMVFIGHIKNAMVIKKPKAKDFVDIILDEWKDAYLECVKEEYIVAVKGKDREAIGTIIKLLRDKNPDMDTETARISLNAFFKRCLNIDDPWLRTNMSPSIIKSQFNKIIKILKQEKLKTVKLYTYDEMIKICRDAGKTTTEMFKQVPQGEGKKPLWVQITDTEAPNVMEVVN